MGADTKGICNGLALFGRVISLIFLQMMETLKFLSNLCKIVFPVPYRFQMSDDSSNLRKNV